MANFPKKNPLKSDERIFSAESALLSYAQPNTLFHISPARNCESPVYFISIDEVGRGCLAGPVVVCTTLWSSITHDDPLISWYPHLRDSKKLSGTKRDILFSDFIQHELLVGSWKEPPELTARPLTKSLGSGNKPPMHLHSPLHSPPLVVKLNGADVQKTRASVKGCPNISMRLAAASIGSASAKEIDGFGVITALGMAASRALEALPKVQTPTVVFFDGNRPLKLTAPWFELPQLLVVQGDDHLKSISASSVIAKVVRDRWMENYSDSFPEFGFEENRGYGTELHRRALSKHGPTPLHRLSFLKNLCPELAH
ncbi:MAG: ribonuclease HII [Betaproteobacteria bacterium]|nr:ribonuclease HII [Betaproteobacteria bacterium]